MFPRRSRRRAPTNCCSSFGLSETDISKCPVVLPRGRERGRGEPLARDGGMAASATPAVHCHLSLSPSSLCSLINRWTVLTSSQPTTMQFSRRFISPFGVEWTAPVAFSLATSCLHSPLLCETNLLFPTDGQNQRDNFVGQTERGGKERDGGRSDDSGEEREEEEGWVALHLDSRNWG